jgi:hypothetical protein
VECLKAPKQQGNACHAIWLYARLTLSFRDVEELLAEPTRCSHTLQFLAASIGVGQWVPTWGFDFHFRKDKR